VLTYRVVNTTNRSIVVDGLGVLEPEQTREFTSAEAEGFAYQRGVQLLQTNVPDGVEVTVITGSEEG
jgi:hypothetical protein